jgi:hypothetical protein
VALGNYPNMPAEYHGTALIKKWVDLLRLKSASDQLSSEELKQLSHDISQA